MSLNSRAIVTASRTRVRRKAPPPCGANEICVFEENDYQGTPGRWSRSHGYRRKVASGDYSAGFKSSKKFGGRIDAMQVYSHCH